jgi:hypothetical protein
MSETCSVFELRQYTLRPGQRDVLIELFDRELVETQEAVGISAPSTQRTRSRRYRPVRARTSW